MTRSFTHSGTFVAYERRELGPAALARIAQVNVILDQYRGALTLRQLYYRLVAAGLIPNEGREYDRLGSIVNTGRMTGLISWTSIEDRGRHLMGHKTCDGPGDALKKTIALYKTDLWAAQRIRPEVWVEKQALEGVIGEICNELRVDFFSCKGYNSQSEQWRAGRRLAGYVSRGQVPLILHLGDHDPSGIDMTRDNHERLSLFAGTPISVKRIALNMPQIEELRPPPNPAKVTDSRAATYIAEYGESSWELDALPPEYIQRLIRGELMAVRDEKLWDEALLEELSDREALEQMAEELT